MAWATFNHQDPDFTLDQLSANRRLQPNADLAVLGTAVVSGPCGTIQVLVPDCTVPPVGNDVQIDLRHVVELQMGPAFDMGLALPPLDLTLSLCPSSLEPTLGLQCLAYWEEINPLLTEWRSVNNAKCPECSRVIKVNMSRHLRMMHTEYVCYWRCPVSACPIWFTPELNGKDHIEHTHQFREGRGHSFYECLRKFGLEWFGSRAFFEQRKVTGQSLWMDLALARRSGHQKPRLRTTPPIFQGCHQPAAVIVHWDARFICSADLYAVSDRLFDGPNLCQFSVIR